MSGVGITAQTTEFTTGTSKLTALQILAAANHRVKVSEFSLSFQGISNVAAPILVEIIRQSTTGLSGDVITAKKLDSDHSETVQTTVLENIDGSTQPTDGDVLFRELVHPQGGFTWQARFGQEIEIPGGGRLGLAVTAGAGVDLVARFVGEE